MVAQSWPCLRPDGDGCRLSVHVVPQASRTAVDGWHDGALRIRLAAPPVDGQANTALRAWLAEQLHLPKRAVRLHRGPASRHKQLVLDAAVADVAAWLARVAPPAP